VDLAQASAWAEDAVRGRSDELAALDGKPASLTQAWKVSSLLSAWDTLGWVRFRQGRLPEAERYVSAAARINGACVAQEHLAEILEQGGHRAEAAAAYARTVAAGAAGDANAASVQLDARRRLDALLPAEQVEAAVGAARGEVLRLRILRRDPAPGAAPADARVLLVLGRGGAVADVLQPFGAPAPGVDALSGFRHGLQWPSPGPERLVLQGRYRCAGVVALGRFDPFGIHAIQRVRRGVATHLLPGDHPAAATCGRDFSPRREALPG
jgi:hypothetical protein